jgi:hypothetical protein
VVVGGVRVVVRHLGSFVARGAHSVGESAPCRPVGASRRTRRKSL